MKGGEHGISHNQPVKKQDTPPLGQLRRLRQRNSQRRPLTRAELANIVGTTPKQLTKY